MAQKSGVTSLTEARKAREKAKGGIPTGTPPIATGFLSAWRAGAWQAQGNPPAAPPAAPVQGVAQATPPNNPPKKGGGNGGGGSNNVPPAQPGKPARSVGEILMRNTVIVGVLAGVGLIYGSYLDDKKDEREKALQTEAIRHNVTTLPAVPSSSTATRSMTYAQTSAMPAVSAPAPSPQSDSADCLAMGRISIGQSCTIKNTKTGMKTDINRNWPVKWLGKSNCVETKEYSAVDTQSDTTAINQLIEQGERSLANCNEFTLSVTEGSLSFSKRN